MIRGEEEKASEDNNLLCVGISWCRGNRGLTGVLYLLNAIRLGFTLGMYGDRDQFHCGLAWLWICSRVLFRFAPGVTPTGRRAAWLRKLETKWFSEADEEMACL